MEINSLAHYGLAQLADMMIDLLTSGRIVVLVGILITKLSNVKHFAVKELYIGFCVQVLIYVIVNLHSF